MDENDRINQLETRVKELERLLDEKNRITEKIDDRFEIPWAGNLGRWDWNCVTGEVVFNPKKVEILGYRYPEFEPKIESFTSLIHPDDFEATMENMRCHLYGESDAYECKYRMRTSSGDYRWFCERGIVVSRDTGGKPLHVTGIVFDITDQQNAEKELIDTGKKLKESLEIKNHFIGIIAHDLRSPFSGLLGLTDLTLQEFETLKKDEILENLTMISESARNIFRLIENLLQWTHLQQNNLVLSFAENDLKKIVDKNCELYGLVASRKGISLINGAQENTSVYADLNSIDTIVRNLISNSIRFTETRGTVTVTIADEGGQAAIIITDTGTGIDPEVLQNLYQLNKKTVRPGTDGDRGSGLGLIISRELAEKNGGKLEVDSIKGKGTTFSLKLPRRKPDER